MVKPRCMAMRSMDSSEETTNVTAAGVALTLKKTSTGSLCSSSTRMYCSTLSMSLCALCSCSSSLRLASVRTFGTSSYAICAAMATVSRLSHDRSLGTISFIAAASITVVQTKKLMHMDNT